MKHAYYMTKDLEEIEQVQHELKEAGLNEEHVHVLSDNEASVEKRDFHPVNPFMRTDVVHSMTIGAVIGVLGDWLWRLPPGCSRLLRQWVKRW